MIRFFVFWIMSFLRFHFHSFTPSVHKTQTSCRSTKAYDGCFLSIAPALMPQLNGMGRLRNTIQYTNCLIPTKRLLLPNWSERKTSTETENTIMKRLLSSPLMSVVNIEFPLKIVQFFSHSHSHSFVFVYFKAKLEAWDWVRWCSGAEDQYIDRE